MLNYLQLINIYIGYIRNVYRNIIIRYWCWQYYRQDWWLKFDIVDIDYWSFLFFFFVNYVECVLIWIIMLEI